MSGKVAKFDLGPLHKFVKSIGNKNFVRVGIFGDKNGRSQKGRTNAEIGAIHEYGSFTPVIIPARSFLRMPLFKKKDEILKEAGQNAGNLFGEGKHMQVLKNLGIACENAIQEAFASRGFGQWKPDAPSTIKRKRSSAPLIDTSQLRRAISSQVK